jgi:MOSC domain-containing protein YiiM
MNTPSLLSVRTGRIAPLGPSGVSSGFIKYGVDGPVGIELLGLAGDEQADLSVHGGPEKAVYGYAASHYSAWSADFPAHAHQFGPGSMGENLTIAGIDEADICVGDVHAIGSTRLQVCQPRQPCFKFALRFGNDRLPHAMIRNGRTGWYYRVLQPGIVRAGDSVTLDERPNPDFAFNRLVAIVYRRGATLEDMTRVAAMAEVASQIRRHAQRVIERAGKGMQA